MVEKEKTQPVILKFRLLSSEAKLPTYAHPGDAGFDIHSLEDKTLAPGDWHPFSTGLSSEFPEGFYVEVRGRSGHAHNHALHVLGGTIDAGFRGEWQIILINLGREPYKVEKRERIAQGLLIPVEHAKIMQTARLSKTQRGVGGFGSTGKK